MVIEDIKTNLENCQYGNQKGVSINHYLVNWIDKILKTLDKNNLEESYALVLNLYYWKKAFDMQCPKLGLQSFISNGVRPALLPVLKSFLQNRKMRVKWHNKFSTERNLNGGGPLWVYGNI